MKIAIVSDPHFPVPPEKYGGTERQVAYLIQGLTALGHQVTLFGPGNSTVACEIIPCSATHLDLAEQGVTLAEVKRAQQRNITNVIARQRDFDLINWYAHVHKNMEQLRRPVLFTLSNPIASRFSPQEIHLLQSLGHVAFTGLSKRFTEVNPQVCYLTSIYSGLPIERFAFSEQPEGYLAFVGRFAAEKQPHLALAAALHLQKPIVVAARLDAFGMPYYQTACEPLMSHPLVTYKGEVTDTGKIGIFQQAAVNLHPVPMEEPFGLTVVEAGLCGTPTIAFDKGSMRELIKEGIAGFVVNNLTELLNVYPRALSLDRKQVRAHFEQFNHLQMAKEYEQAYERLLRRSKGGNEQQEGGW